MNIRTTLLAGFTGLLVACSGPGEPAAPVLIERDSGSVLWPELPPRSHDHVNDRLDVIEALPVMEGGVLFIGDSITEAAPLSTMFPNVQTANHGIAWDTTNGVLLRMNQITRHSPDRIFLMIGTNDTRYTSDADDISDNIIKIIDAITAEMPDSDLYFISVLPRHAPNNTTVSALNQTVRAAAVDRPFVYLDLAKDMRADNSELRPDLTYDNLHLNDDGYRVWASVLDGCVRDGCPEGLTE